MFVLSSWMLFGATIMISVTDAAQECGGAEPLIYWDFEDVTATITDESIASKYNGYFDISMYDGTLGKPRSDPYDSSAGGPYLDKYGRLICQGDEDNFMALSDQNIPVSLSGSKTYVVYGNTLDLTDVGGALISIDSTFSSDGTQYSHNQFDALVYNENRGLEWIAGSESFRRTDLNAFASFDETGAKYDSSTGQVAGIASFVLVYEEDSKTGEVYVTLYRDCEKLGSYNSGSDNPFKLEADTGRFLFCKRHINTGGAGDFVIEYAAYYDYALSEDDIKTVCQCNGAIPTTEKPTTSPTTKDPTPSPTEDPTPSPTIDPTPAPTDNPTLSPTIITTDKPTDIPTIRPTPVPTGRPTLNPTTGRPTLEPTPVPTVRPTDNPIVEFTLLPSVEPTPVPTSRPTSNPTDRPTADPTSDTTTTTLTPDPTTRPTVNPTTKPTDDPTAATIATTTTTTTTQVPTDQEYDCGEDGPEPLIYWDFEDVTATVNGPLLRFFHRGDFDLSMYDGDLDSPRSDPFDSSVGGPYLDGEGRLICQGDDSNYMALTDDNIPFAVSGSKTYVVYGNTLDLTDVGGALMSIDSSYVENEDGTTTYTFNQFDGLVFNEIGGSEWTAGSEYFRRTDSSAFSSFDETGATYQTNTGEYSGIASFVLVYDEDAASGEVYVTLYRNCEKLGTYNSGADNPFNIERDTGRFLFCKRHVNAGLNGGDFVLEYAAYYNYALSESQVANVCQCSNDGNDSKNKYRSESVTGVSKNYFYGNVDYMSMIGIFGIGLVFLAIYKIIKMYYFDNNDSKYIPIRDTPAFNDIRIDNYNSI